MLETGEEWEKKTGKKNDEATQQGVETQDWKGAGLTPRGRGDGGTFSFIFSPFTSSFPRFFPFKCSPYLADLPSCFHCKNISTIQWLLS